MTYLICTLLVVAVFVATGLFSLGLIISAEGKKLSKGRVALAVVLTPALYALTWAVGTHFGLSGDAAVLLTGAGYASGILAAWGINAWMSFSLKGLAHLT